MVPLKALLIHPQTFLLLRIHIRTSSQVLFDRLDVPVFGGIKQCIQFFTRLAPVLGEEVGDFFFT